jgi:hypothetical protein
MQNVGFTSDSYGCAPEVQGEDGLQRAGRFSGVLLMQSTKHIFCAAARRCDTICFPEY